MENIYNAYIQLQRVWQQTTDNHIEYLKYLRCDMLFSLPSIIHTTRKVQNYMRLLKKALIPPKNLTTTQIKMMPNVMSAIKAENHQWTNYCSAREEVSAWFVSFGRGETIP